MLDTPSELDGSTYSPSFTGPGYLLDTPIDLSAFVTDVDTPDPFLNDADTCRTGTNTIFERPECPAGTFIELFRDFGVRVSEAEAREFFDAYVAYARGRAATTGSMVVASRVSPVPRRALDVSRG